jgi:hypothetical protein
MHENLRIFHAQGDRTAEVMADLSEFEAQNGADASRGFEGTSYLASGLTNLIFLDASEKLIRFMTRREGWEDDTPPAE